jgi:hypothetical protein
MSGGFGQASLFARTRVDCGAVIQAFKLELRIMRYELTDGE